MSDIFYCEMIDGKLNNHQFVGEFHYLGQSFEGNSHPDIVTIESKIFGRINGFSKRYEIHGKLNDIEILLKQYAYIFSVKTADIVVVYYDINYLNKYSIVSMNVVSNNSKKLISLKEMRDELYFDICQEENLEKWIIEWLKIRNRKTPEKGIWDVEAKSLNEYKYSLFFGFETVKIYCAKHKFSLNLKEYTTQYINMIIFDIIVQQKDRTPSNYGVIIDNDENAFLSPLFDNSKLYKPYVDSKKVIINNLIGERKMYIDALIKVFGEQAIMAMKSACKRWDNFQNINNNMSSFYLKQPDLIEELQSIIQDGICIMKNYIK